MGSEHPRSHVKPKTMERSGIKIWATLPDLKYLHIVKTQKGAYLC